MDDGDVTVMPAEQFDELSAALDEPDPASLEQLKTRLRRHFRGDCE